jgi:hypothetical protein
MTFPLQQLSQDDVFAQIKNEMLSENLFSAVKIYGTFKHNISFLICANTSSCDNCCNGNVLLALKLVIDAYGTFSSPFNSMKC